jgi:DNA-directed RNA polymerase subunit beta
MREIRKFGSIQEVIELPNLTDIQIKSYNTFLQLGKSTEQRENIGLQSAFKEVFPSTKPSGGGRRGSCSTFLGYTLQPPSSARKSVARKTSRTTPASSPSCNSFIKTPA